MNPFLAGMFGGYGAYSGTQPTQEQDFFKPFDLSGYQVPNQMSAEEIARRAQEERMRNFWLGLAQGALTGQWGGVSKGIGAGLVAGNTAANAQEEMWRKRNDELRDEALARQKAAMEERFRKPQEEMNLLQLAETKRNIAEGEKIRTLAKSDVPLLIDQAKTAGIDWVRSAGTNKDLAASRAAEFKTRMAELEALGQRAIIDEPYFEKFKSTFDATITNFGVAGKALEKATAELSEEAMKSGMTPEERIKFNKRRDMVGVNWTEHLLKKSQEADDPKEKEKLMTQTAIASQIAAQQKALKKDKPLVRAALNREGGLNGDQLSALSAWGLDDPELFQTVPDPNNKGRSVVTLSPKGKAVVNEALSSPDNAYMMNRAQELATTIVEKAREVQGQMKGSAPQSPDELPTGGPMEKVPVPKTVEEAIAIDPRNKDKNMQLVLDMRKQGKTDAEILSIILHDGVRQGLWTLKDIK